MFCVLLYVTLWKRELVVLFSLSSWCLLVAAWLYLAVPWVCLQFVIVVFPDHTHLLFFMISRACGNPVISLPDATSYDEIVKIHIKETLLTNTSFLVHIKLVTCFITYTAKTAWFLSTVLGTRVLCLRTLQYIW